MKIIKFKSSPPKTFFAPQYEYVLGEDKISDIDYQHVYNKILHNEKDIIANFPTVDRTSIDGYTGLGTNSLTSRFDYFNPLSWDDIEFKKLNSQILTTYHTFLNILNIERQKVWIKCWANVMRAGEKISPHIHCVNEYTYLGGHVVISCNNTNTYYINPVNQINEPQFYQSENSVGKLTFFQQNIPHYTDIHKAEEPRITIAFDLVVDEYKNFETNLIPFDTGDK